jgi:vancomycin resistance protein YoaR
MGNEPMSDAEKLAKFETKLDIELAAIKESLNDLKQMFMSSVTKEILAAELRLRDKEIDAIQDELDKFKEQYEKDKQNAILERQAQKTTKPNWWQVVLGAIGLFTSISLGIIALLK